MGRGIIHSWVFLMALCSLALSTGGCGNGQPYNPMQGTNSGGPFDDFGGSDLPPEILDRKFVLRLGGVNCDPSAPGVRATITVRGGTATWKDLCLGTELTLETQQYVASHGSLGVVYGGYLYLSETFSQPRVACAFSGLNLIVISMEESGLTLFGGFEDSDPSFTGIIEGFAGGALTYHSSEAGLHGLNVPVTNPGSSSLDMDLPTLSFTGPANCILY